MPVVVYNDKQGYTYLMRVPDGTLERDYHLGIVLGPPDLSALNLKAPDEKRLRQALVESGLVSAEEIRGSASKLYQVVQITLPKHDTKAVVRGIKAIYQHEFFAVAEETK